MPAAAKIPACLQPPPNNFRYCLARSIKALLPTRTEPTGAPKPLLRHKEMESKSVIYMMVVLFSAYNMINMVQGFTACKPNFTNPTAICSFYGYPNFTANIQGTVKISCRSSGLRCEQNGLVASCDHGVHLNGTLLNIPAGKHGFHFHQYGDLSGANGTSAGEHFNALNVLHGCTGTRHNHTGDMGNFVAGGTGSDIVNINNKNAKLRGIADILGRALVLHAGQDDCVTQPTGNSGSRLAVCAIGLANPTS